MVPFKNTYKRNTSIGKKIKEITNGRNIKFFTKEKFKDLVQKDLGTEIMKRLNCT